MPSARGFASPIHARSGSYARRYGRRDCRREPRAPHAESFLTTASSRPGRQPTHHRLLDIENTRQLAVVVVRPPADLVPYSNQLSSDANAASFAPHATFEHLVHVQFLADLRPGLVGLLAGHGRGTGDHSHAIRRHLPQSHDCLLTQAIAEILLRFATQVFEGKNGEP